MTDGENLIHVHVGHQLPDGLPSPDVYFTPGYGRAACVTEGGDWALLEAFDGAWQVPLIVRTLVHGTLDAITPHYSGIYASPALTAAQVNEAWVATVTCLRDLGVISVLLRDSPLVPHAPQLPWQQSIASGHPTIVLEPTDVDTAWADLEKRCRTKVRKALKNGYTGGVRKAERQDLAEGSDFRRLYEETMYRLDAAPVYFFGDEYYKQLFDGLGSDLLIAEVRDKLGEVAASSLNLRHADRVHGHLTGSNADERQMGTNNLLKWVMIEFALDQGLRQFHIGGGVGPDDSLFKFKRSFGGRELRYGISGVIIHPEAYATEVERRAKECDTTTDALLAAKFFPAYRAEIPHV